MGQPFTRIGDSARPRSEAVGALAATSTFGHSLSCADELPADGRSTADRDWTTRVLSALALGFAALGLVPSVDAEPGLASLWRQFAAWAVPLALVLGAVVWRGVHAKRAASASRTPAPLHAATRAAHDTALHVLATRVEMRLGRSWQCASEVLAQGQGHPILDTRWSAGQSAAVFTAPVEGLDPRACRQSLEALAAGLPWVSLAGLDLEAMTRALALVQPCLAKLGERLSEVITAAPLHHATPRRPLQLQLQLALPSRWPGPLRSLARAWLHEQTRRLVVEAQEAGLSLEPEVITVDDGPALMHQLEGLRLAWARGRSRGVALLLAADSRISRQAVHALAAQGLLYGSTHPDGCVPGEGAAGLLLASPDWSGDADHAADALLHATAIVKRDATPRTVSCGALRRAAEKAVTPLPGPRARPLPEITHITADVDMQPALGAELFGTIEALAPDLVTRDGLLRLGIGCGDLGVAGAWVGLALAAERTGSTGQAGLMLGLSDARRRLACFISPVKPDARCVRHA